MIYRHTKEYLESNYSASDALNQSSIKVILKEGMESFLAQKEELLLVDEQPYYDEKEHYLIGSAVDDINSQGEDYFKNKYFFSRLSRKPSLTGMSILNMAFDTVKSRTRVEAIEDPSQYKEILYTCIEAHKYYDNRRKGTYEEDTRWATLLKENAIPYWNTLKEANGRIILSESQNAKIENIIKSFTTHPFTYRLYNEAPNVDIVLQFPIFWVYEDVRCKGLIDRIIVNHNNKCIYLIDDKTTWDYVTRFNKQMKKLRYDIQGSFYHHGFRTSYNLNRLKNKIERNVDLSTYTIKDFAFVVESTTRQGTPLIFPMTNRLVDHGKFGDRVNLQGWHHGVLIYKNWADKRFDVNEVFKEHDGVAFIDETFEYQNKII